MKEILMECVPPFEQHLVISSEFDEVYDSSLVFADDVALAGRCVGLPLGMHWHLRIFSVLLFLPIKLSDLVCKD